MVADGDKLKLKFVESLRNKDEQRVNVSWSSVVYHVRVVASRRTTLTESHWSDSKYFDASATFRILIYLTEVAKKGRCGPDATARPTGSFHKLSFSHQKNQRNFTIPVVILEYTFKVNINAVSYTLHDLFKRPCKLLNHSLWPYDISKA